MSLGFGPTARRSRVVEGVVRIWADFGSVGCRGGLGEVVIEYVLRVGGGTVGSSYGCSYEWLEMESLLCWTFSPHVSTMGGQSRYAHVQCYSFWGNKAATHPRRTTLPHPLAPMLSSMKHLIASEPGTLL